MKTLDYFTVNELLQKGVDTRANYFNKLITRGELNQDLEIIDEILNHYGYVYNTISELEKGLINKTNLLKEKINFFIDHEKAHSQVIENYGLTPTYRLVLMDFFGYKLTNCSVLLHCPKEWGRKEIAEFDIAVISAVRGEGEYDSQMLKIAENYLHSEKPKI